MGKSTGNQQQPRSRSPRIIGSQTNNNNTDLFKAQNREVGLNSQAMSHNAHSSGLNPSHSDRTPMSETNLANDQPVNLGALRSVASDIKDTLAAAIADLKQNFQSMGLRMDDLENTASRHEVDIHHNRKITSAHSSQLLDMQRHIEDLDNRGRRHNLRVRGIPENIEPNLLTQMTCDIFNDLLGRPPGTTIELERLHRALRPKGRDSDPPRDVVCCLVSFRIKEEILRKARERRDILLHGSEIKIFQDLSPITLQKRRDLRPLLDLLRSRSITYRWKFPFCLSATSQGHTALLRSPADIHSFCATLNLPLIELPDWGNPYDSSSTRQAVSMDTVPERDDLHLRRRRSPSPRSFISSTPRSNGNLSPTASPAHRRPRQDISK